MIKSGIRGDCDISKKILEIYHRYRLEPLVVIDTHREFYFLRLYRHRTPSYIREKYDLPDLFAPLKIEYLITDEQLLEILEEMCILVNQIEGAAKNDFMEISD